MTKKTLSAVCAVLVAVLLVLTCGIGSSWFTNGNIGTWFNSWGKGDKRVESSDGSENSNNSGSFDVEFEESKDNSDFKFLSALLPASAYEANSVATSALVAYTITATLRPATVENKLVDWSIVNSEDNSDVSEYATLSTQSDGALTVTLSILRAFPNKILKLVCTSRDSGASGFLFVRCEGIATGMSIAGSTTQITNCRWGNTNTYAIALSNAIGYVGESQYTNLEVKSVTLYGTVNYYQQFFVEGLTSTKYLEDNPSWSQGKTTVQLSTKYPDALKASISGHNLVLTMSAYPSATYSSVSTTTVSGKYGLLYTNLYQAPKDAYAVIVVKTGNLEKSFTVGFTVGVEGVIVGDDIVI